MKITIDVRMLHSSGIGTYIQNLVPSLIELRSQDQFYLLGRKREGPEWTKNPAVQWIECRSPIYSLGQQWELLEKTPKDTDLLWIPHYDIPVFYRGKMLVTVHDLFPLAFWPSGMALLKHWYARLMFSRVAHKAEAVICVSEYTRKELLRLTGTRGEKARVIHEGVAPFWFQPAGGTSPHPRPYLLSVGNVKPNKNLGGLLEAFKIIKNQVPHDLVLVGRKEGFITGAPEVLKQAEEFGDRVRFTGWVDNEKLKSYYAHAQALVFPSLYEGFGFPPLEAMACGCPVVTSWAASLPEVCGGAALYFDPLKPPAMADRILEVLREDSLREELIQKGRERAKKFSWDVSAAQTSALMDKITGFKNE